MGAGVIVLANGLLHRPEPAGVVPVQGVQPGDTGARPEAEPARPAVTASYRKGPEPAPAKPAESLAAEARSAGALEPGTDAEWDALVGGMLEWEVERRTGQKLPAEQRARLLAQLARLRDASLALQEAPGQPGDPAELRDRLTRTLVLAQVDEAFRRELRVGVAEFLQGLDPLAVEDVSAPLQQ